MDKLVATASDAEIGRLPGRLAESMKARRLLLGIKIPKSRQRWPRAELALHGTPAGRRVGKALQPVAICGA